MDNFGDPTTWAVMGSDGKPIPVTEAGASRRREVWLRDQGICGICEQPVAFEEMQLDHIIPQSWGGSDEPYNVQPAHALCNQRKGNRLNRQMTLLARRVLELEGKGGAANGAAELAYRVKLLESSRQRWRWGFVVINLIWYFLWLNTG
jgi:hypothetical protein